MITGDVKLRNVPLAAGDSPHRANLADVGRRYADVVGVDEAVAGLEAIAGA